jgi:hypothetical protein
MKMICDVASLSESYAGLIGIADVSVVPIGPIFKGKAVGED